MEHKAMVRLVPQAKLVKGKNQIGVSCPGLTVWAKDSLQAALLKEIAEKPKSVAELERALQPVQDDPGREAYAALILAEFILTFGEVIED